MHAEIDDPITQALQYLSGVCDGAVQKDHAGFNRLDSNFGKGLAEQASRRSLTPAQQRAAYKLLCKYRTQLANAGIELPESEDELPALSQPANSGANQEAPVIIGRVVCRAQPAPASKGSIQVSGDLLLVRFGYDPKLVDKIKSLPYKQRRWNPSGRFWEVDPDVTDALIKLFPDFTLDPALAALRDEKAAQAELEKQQEQAKRAALFAAMGDLAQPLPGGKVLMKHQRDGVVWMLARDRMILGDQMGLGKTLTALVAAKAYGLPVLVVCPATLRDNWLIEAAQVGVKIGVYSWAKLPLPLEETDYVLICDEAHYAQNWKAKRTERMVELARSDRCQAVFLLTGTPLKNGRPANLFPLLYALRHSLADNKSHYERYFCAAGPTAFSAWDTTGFDHLDELHIKTANVILRRKKVDCLDLPEKTRVIRAAEFSAQAKRDYEETRLQLAQEYRTRLAAKLAALRDELRAENITQAEYLIKAQRIRQAEALVTMNHLRHAGSVGKVATALELAEEVLEQDRQVVIFVAFKEAGERLARTLGCGFLSGDTDMKDRQPMIERFQAGHSKAIICSFGAGGVGVTLTAADTVILVDRPWTPGDAEQAEDRLHRISQRSAVTAIWLQVPGANSVDVKIDEILESKQENIELVLDGKAVRLARSASPEQIAQALLPGILGIAGTEEA